jgi:hypothetical protein
MCGSVPWIGVLVASTVHSVGPYRLTALSRLASVSSDSRFHRSAGIASPPM